MKYPFASTHPAEKLFETVRGFPVEIWILLGAVALVVVGFIVWAVFIRPRPEEVSGWGPEQSKYEPSTKVDQGSGHRRRKWRRRRREHRPRNPTLAETGGLPPIRQNNSPAGPDA